MTASARGLLSGTGRLVAVAALLSAALLAVVLLVSSDDPALTGRLAIVPLRVTSGGETATGFAVGPNRVVTVAHLVDGAVKEGGTDRVVRVRRARAGVLRVDRHSDLALLAVRGIGGRSPVLAGVGAGDEVRVVRLRRGRSSPLSVRVRRAIIAHVRAPGAERTVTRPALELGARVRAGDSGAPVVSGSGALAGVIFAASSGREDTAYAVDASAMSRLLLGD